MNSISHIRAKLKVTQQALAEALQVSQGNVSHYERGQSVPPEVAKRLIIFAGKRGHALTFDDIYGAPPASSPSLSASVASTAVTQVNATGETA